MSGIIIKLSHPSEIFNRDFWGKGFGFKIKIFNKFCLKSLKKQISQFKLDKSGEEYVVDSENMNNKTD